jgi:hypothetical protein
VCCFTHEKYVNVVAFFFENFCCIHNGIRRERLVNFTLSLARKIKLYSKYDKRLTNIKSRT